VIPACGKAGNRSRGRQTTAKDLERRRRKRTGISQEARSDANRWVGDAHSLRPSRASALSEAAALRHPWLRWPPTPALWAWAHPPCRRKKDRHFSGGTKRRQPVGRGLRSLGGGCAPPSMAPLAAYAGSLGMGTPSLRPPASGKGQALCGKRTGTFGLSYLLYPAKPAGSA